MAQVQQTEGTTNHRPLTPAEKRDIEESIDALRAAMRLERRERKARADVATAEIFAALRARYKSKTARERALARGWCVIEGGKR